MNEVGVDLPEGKPLLLLFANDIELEADIHEFADSVGLHLVQSDTAIDLIALTAVAQVVDIEVCKPDDWQAVREYLAECEKGEMPDDTPLIFVNYRKGQEAQIAGLAKSIETIHRCHAGCASEVTGIINSCTAGSTY